MRAIWIALLLASLALAGCADDGSAKDETTDDTDFSDQQIEVDDDTGGIRGVVVDQTITPLAGATITLDPGSDSAETTSDEQGRFTFSKVAPGTHIILVTAPLYDEVQSSVEVVAGVAEPDIVRVQLTRIVEEEPFVEGFDFQGRIVCSYRAVLIRAPCITDYTTIACNGGCLGRDIGDQIRSLQGDTRDFRYAINPGWKSHIIEIIWEPSAQGTSDQLGVTVSFMNRTASDWYASHDSTSPLHLQMTEGVPGPNPQGVSDLGPEGQPEMLTFVNVGGDTLQLSLEQDFQIIFHTSYHLPLPDGWSFLNGDQSPF